jgi:hypothetical protein
VIAFAVLIALLATPAFGVQALVLELLGRKNVSFSSSRGAPNEVKKMFEDLSRVAVFAPGALPGRARDAGTVVVAGHRRHLYVLPTKQGGYCFVIEQAIGSCRSRAQRANGFSVGFMGQPPAPVQRVDGDVAMPSAASITVHYADGSTAEVPFIWVSAPIAAGFFSYDIPATHQTADAKAVSVTIEASDGQQLAIQTLTPPFRTHPAQRRPHRLHFHPPSLEVTVTPTPPLHEATSNGYRIVVGSNGAAQFTRLAITPENVRLKLQFLQYSCFHLTTEFGIFTVQSYGSGGPFAQSAGLNLSGVGRPVDGCQIGAANGHLWPDANGSHTPVELALTAKGRAYFANRAAARDLALFVHTRRVQQLRHEPPAQAIRDLKRVYAKPLARSPIRMTVRHGALVFSERSSTGRLFTVVVRDGKIAHQNVKPFAFAF